MPYKEKLSFDIIIKQLLPPSKSRRTLSKRFLNKIKL